MFLGSITWCLNLFSRMFAHFSNHPNGRLHLAIALQGVLILSMGIWIALQVIANSRAGAFKPNFPKIAVEAAPVKIGDFEQFVTAVGTLRSNHNIIVKPEIDAKVKEIFVESGQTVKKGDKLISLDDGSYKAKLKEAEAKLVNARASHRRAEGLFKKRAISAKDKEEAHARLLISEADVEFAKAQLSKATLYAPFDGVLGIVDLSLGRYVKPGDDLFTLDDMDPIKVDFRVGEVILSKLHVGDQVTVEVDGFPHNSYVAKIEAIDTNVDPLGHSIRIQASFDNSEGELRPGLFAKVKLRTAVHRNTIMIPESAVESRGKQEYVYTVEQGVAKMVPIKTGARNGENVQVTRGLKPGARVIFSGQMKVQPNYPVFVVPSRLPGR